MWRLENPRWRMLTCSLRSIRDNFVQQTLSVVPIDLPKDLFSCKIHQGKIAKTYRLLVTNLATNIWILVARAVILVALATVLGAISCPAFTRKRKENDLDGKVLCVFWWGRHCRVAHRQNRVARKFAHAHIAIFASSYSDDVIAIEVKK